MKELIIQPGGKLLVKTWDTNQKKILTHDETATSMVYLPATVQLEDNVTVRDIFKLMEQNREFYSILFHCCFFDEFLDVVLNEASTQTPYFDYVQLSREVSIINQELSFDTIPIFSGVRRSEESDETIYYALDLTELSSYIDTPLKLNAELKVYGNKNLKGETTYSLLDVFMGIMWEISFHGKPGSLEAVVDDLQKQIKSIQDGTAELYTWEEVFASIKEKKGNDESS